MAGDWTRWDRHRLLWSTPGLRAREMRVLAFLLDRQGAAVTCWPSSAAIAEALEIDPRNVRKELASLARRGLIVERGRRGMTGSIIEWECCPRTEAASDQMQHPPGSCIHLDPKVHPPGPRSCIQVDAEAASRRMHGSNQEPIKEPIREPKERGTARKPRRTVPAALVEFRATVLEDFNAARARALGSRHQGVTWTRECSSADRGRLAELLKALGPDGAREHVRCAMRHQFTDPHLRERYPGLVNLLRHIDQWADAWRTGASKAGANGHESRDAARARRNYEAAQAFMAAGGDR